MYEDIGKKIKGLAKAVFIIEAIAAVIGGFVMMAEDGDMALIGLLSITVGILVAWVSSWFVYGFGELIDKVCDIERHMRGEEPEPEFIQVPDYRVAEFQKQTGDERLSRLENLRSQGLISEEEYQQAMLREQ